MTNTQLHERLNLLTQSWEKETEGLSHLMEYPDSQFELISIESARDSIRQCITDVEALLEQDDHGIVRENPTASTDQRINELETLAAEEGIQLPCSAELIAFFEEHSFYMDLHTARMGIDAERIRVTPAGRAALAQSPI